MKVRKLVYGPVPKGSYESYLGAYHLEIRVEVEGREYGYARTFPDNVPFHVVKQQAFREVGAEIARRLEELL
jgi:hypothetical protein